MAIPHHTPPQAGFRTQQAENGADALDTLSSSPPGHFAAMVTDLCMPVLNGYDTVRAIRASELVHGTRLPVICCTSEELDACSSMHPEETVLQHGMLCGFDEIVVRVGCFFGGRRLCPLPPTQHHFSPHTDKATQPVCHEDDAAQAHGGCRIHQCACCRVLSMDHCRELVYTTISRNTIVQFCRVKSNIIIDLNVLQHVLFGHIVFLPCRALSVLHHHWAL